MVGCLDGDDVRAEIGSKEETQGLDDVGSLGLASRQAELSELLIWAQHHQLRAKNNPGRKNERVQRSYFIQVKTGAVNTVEFSYRK